MGTARSWMADHEHRLRLLKAILIFGIASTGIHFTHNFIAVDSYPTGFISEEVIQVAIIVSWPLLTAVGIAGYRLYAQGRYAAAHPALLSYSVLGLATPGHFLNGNPDIPAFFYVTIFTDGIAGLAMVAFVVWSARLSRVGEPRAAHSAT
jgi:hypothetical protein